MDEVTSTSTVYESNSEAFVEKYRSESVAARFGDDFYTELSGKRVLDVGCGPGADTETFSSDGFDVVGFDLTASFIETAHATVPDASFVRGDMRRLPFRDETFDGVWSCASFLHVPRANAPETLREFRRVLAPEGVAYLSLKHGETSGYDHDGRYFERYLPEEIRSLLADAGFSSIDIDTMNVDGGNKWLNILASIDSRTSPV
ncbi:class I SAM-dependent methyltransferase [Haloferax mediterranei ATCC 33500]|uniref:Class I SAM-dependent methyltransferase n=1 Tax=Haloferax mediterranei (strain ATCC 33500 / DSM 1411 / JCM 8866 / NBRC 14739 / NCIMB 2177 / R-4) TaxID=523841 RepID=I3R494_HALMT|nr:class I SAM-dependent methyltransferase [Haloferax mediterranei]AFK19054.1 ubiquinone/menaquinone biosynthesis methyltransferase UbiE [Haloferax mediterranei ATCC 33500]AHZ21587.1 ubiquinone biosynthesis methyltransferase UbiE [Haloferax mediterranei ATCC 33500]EMA04051.1 ubiquinone/menaquinone biosynthesis methyltransferase UbiE [Haloferax mediterranei ATCC 33500]MDX5989144.1 class I SAM-dependent methyltransferase [Haloferax mediterranei ATCC 33500]QCQ75527.1 class I SAM-dependent methylt